MKKQILLSISILVSGRESTTNKCINSLDRLRRRVPCELILVDTGCSEEMRQWIKQRADKVISFQWCNDFAAARNAGLREASGEWFMFLDDDEWFEDTRQLEVFFLSGEYKGYASASYIIRNYIDMEGQRWQDVPLPRMVRKNRDTCFVYPVHEMLWPRYEPMKYFEDYVHHYGYASADSEAQKEKHQRNLSLLLPAIEKDSDCMHHYLQAVMEYIAMDDFVSALQMAEDGIKHYDSGREHDDNFFCGLCAAAVKIRVLERQYEEAAKRGKELLANTKLSRLAKASMNGDLVIAWSAVTGQCAVETSCQEASETGDQEASEASRQEKTKTGYQQESEAGRQEKAETGDQEASEAGHQKKAETWYQETSKIGHQDTVEVGCQEVVESRFHEVAGCLRKYLQEKEYFSSHSKEMLAQQTLILDQCFEVYHYQMIMGWGFAAALYSRKTMEAEALLQRESIAWWMEVVQNWYTYTSEPFRERWKDNFQILATEGWEQCLKIRQLYHVLTAPAPEEAGEKVYGQEADARKGNHSDMSGQSVDERQAARAEMEVLAAKLKVQIRFLIEQHQEQAALAAIRQVLQFLPTDEELLELLKELEGK